VPRTKSPKLAAGRKRRLRVVRSGLHEEAAARLRTSIVRGEFGPGEQLVEADICEGLGISRTPLREALKLLAAEGLVELRLNRSSIVAPLRREELQELFEAVAGVERIAAEFAAQRMTARDHEKLFKLQERMDRHHDAGEVRDYFDLNQQVHAFIVSCSRNGVLRAVHDSLLARAERARFFALSSQGRWDQSVEEHRAVMAALAERDSDAAGRLLARHVMRTGEAVAETLVGAAPEHLGRRAQGDTVTRGRSS
jgi:DNA-binding GntR family transcriptional regulator